MFEQKKHTRGNKNQIRWSCCEIFHKELFDEEENNKLDGSINKLGEIKDKTNRKMAISESEQITSLSTNIDNTDYGCVEKITLRSGKTFIKKLNAPKEKKVISQEILVPTNNEMETETLETCSQSLQVFEEEDNNYSDGEPSLSGSEVMELKNTDVRKTVMPKELEKEISQEILVPTNNETETEALETCSQSLQVFEEDSNYSDGELSLSDGEVIKLENKAVRETILAKELEQKLKNLDIKITWDVPELHVLCPATRCPSPNELSNCEPYTKEESEMIMERWKEFRKLYKIKKNEYKGFLPNYKKFYLQPEQRLNFLMFIGQDLHERPLYSIYRKFVHLTSNFNTGPFSRIEDKVLLSVYKKNKHSAYTICSKLLNRNRYNIYRRLNKLRKYDIHSLTNKSKIQPQKQPINQKLIQTLALKQKADRKSLAKIEWNEVAEKCGVEKGKLKKHWHLSLLPRLFATHPVQRLQLIIQLIKHLYKYNEADWNKIPWRDLSEKFFSLGEVFLYNILRRIIKKYVKKKYWKNFNDCMNVLYHEVLPQYVERSKISDRRLKRLNLRDGKLKKIE